MTSSPAVQSREEIARDVFERIREQPYSLAQAGGERASNCMAKALDLVQSLLLLGYGARFRIGEMRWDDTPLPKDIAELYPYEIPATHLYVEALIGEKWRALDPSFDSALAKAGFPIAAFDGLHSPAVKLTRVYDEDEQAAYILHWQSRDVSEEYFRKAGPFLAAANSWFRVARVG